MKKKIIVSVTTLLVLMGSACKKENCDGFDTIIEMESVLLYAEDTLQYFDNVPNQFFGVSFSIFDETKSKNGTRNCNQKDFVVKNEDVWDEARVSLTCDKELKSGSQTFYANSELIRANITRLTFEKYPWGALKDGRIDLVGLDGINQSADYTFTLKLATTNNKEFTASTVVHIKK